MLLGVAVVALDGCNLRAGQSAPVGRWKSDRLCLELLGNRDFEMSLQGPDQPKRLVMGTVAAAGDGLSLTVSRIWSSAYLGKCREVHSLGQFVDRAEALGVDLAPGQVGTFTLREEGDGRVELCGTECATLQADVPLLSGRWRLESRPYQPGELVELDVGDKSAHLWLATAVDEHDAIYGEATVKSQGDDRFEVQFVAEEGTRRFDVRRLSGERAEVCGEDGRCAVMERQFAEHSYSFH